MSFRADLAREKLKVYIEKQNIIKNTAAERE